MAYQTNMCRYLTGTVWMGDAVVRYRVIVLYIRLDSFSALMVFTAIFSPLISFCVTATAATIQHAVYCYMIKVFKFEQIFYFKRIDQVASGGRPMYY